jgi:hypothetical protein
LSTVLYPLRVLVELLLWPLDRLPPLLSLTLLGAVTGVAMLWVVGKCTPQRWVERARSRMSACVYEVRLFMDSPRRVFGSQGRLLGWSGVYIATMLPALLVILAPLGLLYLHLEARHGLAPLPVGEPLVVRADVAPGVDGDLLVAEGGPGVEVTAPPVFDRDAGRVYFRVVVAEPGERELTVRAGERAAVKALRAGESGRAAMAAPERASGLALLWTLGDESPLSGDAPVRSIAVNHPPLERSWLYMPWWWLYWLLVATVVALLLHRRFDVAL